MAPSVRESKLLFITRTSLVIGHLKIWLGPPFLSAANSKCDTAYIIFCISVNTNYSHQWHWFWWKSSFTKNNPFARFCILFFHISFTCRLWRNSFLHLLQNSPGMCCALLWSLLGEGGISLFGSLMFSTMSSLKLTIRSTSAIHVLSDSSFKEWLWVSSILPE